MNNPKYVELCLNMTLDTEAILQSIENENIPLSSNEQQT